MTTQPQALLTNLTCSDEEAQWPVQFAPDLTVKFVGKEIRRERTGVHALVLITLGTSVLAFDDFNVLRIPDRRRLAKAFMELLTDEQKTFIRSADVMHSLDLFCAYLGQQYETAHLEIETVAADWTPQAVRFALEPYLLDGAGMILFAPPGQPSRLSLRQWRFLWLSAASAYSTYRNNAPHCT